MKETTIGLEVTATPARCPVGERIGTRNKREGAIPVLSCEGACIRGEIARLAANRVAQAPGFRRGCHGELFAVPHSAMATWVRGAREVVVIDGCHLKCHSRIAKHLVEPNRLRSFDALSHYRKFTDQFDIDSVPEPERNAVAGEVAQWVLKRLQPSQSEATSVASPSGTDTPPTSCPSRTGTSATGCPSGAPTTGSCASSSSAGDPASLFVPGVAELVGIGAAVAANCEPCLKFNLPEAERNGVSPKDIGRAVAVGVKVKDTPHRKIMSLVERFTHPQPETPAAPAASPCCAANGGA
jgi:hypothetical protein